MFSIPWLYPSTTPEVPGYPAAHRRGSLWQLPGESPDPSAALAIPTRIKNASTTVIWISSGSTHPSKAHVLDCFPHTPNGFFHFLPVGNTRGGVQFWLTCTSCGNRAADYQQHNVAIDGRGLGVMACSGEKCCWDLAAYHQWGFWIVCLLSVSAATCCSNLKLRADSVWAAVQEFLLLKEFLRFKTLNPGEPMLGTTYLPQKNWNSVCIDSQVHSHLISSQHFSLMWSGWLKAPLGERYKSAAHRRVSTDASIHTLTTIQSCQFNHPLNACLWSDTQVSCIIFL